VNKQEFRQYIVETFDYDEYTMEFIDNILNYADGMDASEQYRFFTAMFSQLSDREIRMVEY
jgi:hypothetical protein